MGASLSGAQIAALLGRLNQKAAQRCGLGHVVGKGFPSVGADKTIRVMLGRQKQEFDAAHIGGKGQGSVQRFASRPASCRVAVETKSYRVSETKQLLHMFVGAGRSQCCNRIGKPQLRQRGTQGLPKGTVAGKGGRSKPGKNFERLHIRALQHGAKQQQILARYSSIRRT